MKKFILFGFGAAFLCLPALSSANVSSGFINLSEAKTEIKNSSLNKEDEPQKVILWENPGLGEESYSGRYRFCNVFHMTNECCEVFFDEDWNRIKTGTFYFDFEAPDTAFSVWVTTGWWSETWDTVAYGNEHLTDNGDGTYTIEINFEGADILSTIDWKHLLFTGSGYTPINLYYYGEEPERLPYTVLWDNDGTLPEAEYNGLYRFGFEGGPSPELCIAVFSQDEWNTAFEKHTVYLDLKGEDPSIFIRDAWWIKTWGPAHFNDYSGEFEYYMPINPSHPIMKNNGDGTYTLKMNFVGNTDFLTSINEHNLMFNGEGYTPLRLYYGEKPSTLYNEVFGENKELTPAVYDYNFSFKKKDSAASSCNIVLEEAEWERIKTETFYMDVTSIHFPEGEPTENDTVIKVMAGDWTTYWPSGEYVLTDDLIDNGDGTYTLPVNFAESDIVDKIDDNGLLFLGQNFTPIRWYFKSDEFYINNFYRECIGFRNKAYIAADKDYATPGDTVNLTLEYVNPLDTFDYAISVTYGDGEQCELTELGNNSFSFVMPEANVNITALMDTDYTVSFDLAEHDVAPIDDQILPNGSKVSKPNNPYDPEWLCVEWCKDNTISIPWDFEKDVITKHTTLYSKWEEITGVALKKAPTKFVYKYGEDLDLTGCEITVTTINGDSTRETDVSFITPDLIEGYDKNKLGEQTLKIKYGEFECTQTFNVTVLNYISEVSVSVLPTKVEYLLGEDLDLEGSKISIVMADGSTNQVDITPEMISGYDKTKVGEQNVCVTYEDAGCTYKTTFKVVVTATEPTPTPTPTPTQGGLSTGAVVGIAIGCAVAGVGLTLLLTFLLKKKKFN